MQSVSSVSISHENNNNARDKDKTATKSWIHSAPSQEQATATSEITRQDRTTTTIGTQQDTSHIPPTPPRKKNQRRRRRRRRRKRLYRTTEKKHGRIAKQKGKDLSCSVLETETRMDGGTDRRPKTVRQTAQMTRLATEQLATW